MVMSGVPARMVDALRRVRRRMSGTRLLTCCARPAETRTRSEALHRMLTIGRPAADRAGARPTISSASPHQIVNLTKRYLYDRAAAPSRDSLTLQNTVYFYVGIYFIIY